MNLKASLYEELLADASVSALVSDRVYPDRADQTTTMPYITYEELFNEGVHQFQGVDTLDKSRIQFSIWANNSAERTSVEDAVRALLDGQRRNMGTTNITFINRSENTSKQDVIENADDGSQNVVYGKFMDFEFWHIRT